MNGYDDSSVPEEAHEVLSTGVANVQINIGGIEVNCSEQDLSPLRPEEFPCWEGTVIQM